MHNRFLIISFIVGFLKTCAFHSSAQQGEFQIRVGAGLAFYGTKSEYSYTVHFLGQNYYFFDKKIGEATTVHYPVELRYGFSNRWNAGMDLKFGSYLYDPDSGEGKSNAFWVIGPHVEFNFISKESFRLYAGVGFNYAILELQEDQQVNSNNRYSWKYGGGGLRFNTGILWFFANPLGLHFNGAFDSHNFFDLKKYEINNTSVNLTNIKSMLKVKGAELVLGLVLRL